MDALTGIAGIAGFFAGLAIALVGFVVFQHLQTQKQIRKVDRERQLLLNKAFVRDGQVKIFPDAIVNEDLEYEPEKPKAPIRIERPFASGLKKKREELEKTPAAKAADNLPSSVKENIQKAAEKYREAA